MVVEFLSSVLVPHYSSALQVGSPRLTSIAQDFDPLCNMEDRIAEVDEECSGSIQGDCLPFQFSKLYLMYSTIDAAFAILDFANGNIEDGVVNSPLSRGTSRLRICSPSPLQGCNWNHTRQHSCSLTKKTIHTPQRQLYSKPPKYNVEDAKENNLVHFDKEVQVQPASKLLKLLLHRPSQHQLLEERDHLYQTQSLTR